MSVKKSFAYESLYSARAFFQTAEIGADEAKRARMATV